MAKKLESLDELDPIIKRHIQEVLANCIARHIVEISIEEVLNDKEKDKKKKKIS